MSECILFQNFANYNLSLNRPASHAANIGIVKTGPLIKAFHNLDQEPEQAPRLVKLKPDTTLDTAKIIKESSELYGVPPEAHKNTIRDSCHYKALINRVRLQAIRDAFPSIKTGNIWHLSKRNSGLKAAITQHLGMMQQQEPTMFDFCLSAAQKLHEQRSLTKAPDAIITIAVHESEKLSCKLLIKSLIEQKGLEDQNIEVYFFVNGQNPGNIAQTSISIADIWNTLNSKPGSMRASVISAPINSWRYGLKAIPANIAMMELMLSGLLEDDKDSDIPIIFFDADLLNIDEDLIKNRIDSIADGHVLAGGEYSPWSLLSKENIRKMGISHINLELLKILLVSLASMKLSLKTDKESASVEGTYFTSVHYSGANSCSSLMALAYSLGIKAFSFYEEVDWQGAIKDLFTMAFGVETVEEARDYRLFAKKSSTVYSDAGEYARVISQGLKTDHEGLWESHEGEQGRHPKVNLKDPELNLERLRFDIEDSLKSRLAKLTKGKLLSHYIKPSKLEKIKRSVIRAYERTLNKLTKLPRQKDHWDWREYFGELQLIRGLGIRVIKKIFADNRVEQRKFKRNLSRTR